MKKLLFLISMTMTFTYADSAIFAGGCFWCMEKPFDVLPGVKSTTSGYIGGKTKNPTYKDVSSGRSGHIEAIKIEFDPKKISYEKLLDTFWRQVNPTDAGGQFVDRGPQYATAIFYLDSEQLKVAKQSKKNIQKHFKKKVITPLISATTFYAAEDYHQDYYKKSPIRYKFYRYNSGRDQYLNKQWKK